MDDLERQKLKEDVSFYLKSQEDLADCYNELARQQAIPEVQAYLGAIKRLEDAKDNITRAKDTLFYSVTGTWVVTLGERGVFVVDRNDVVKAQSII